MACEREDTELRLVELTDRCLLARLHSIQVGERGQKGGTSTDANTLSKSSRVSTGSVERLATKTWPASFSRTGSLTAWGKALVPGKAVSKGEGRTYSFSVHKEVIHFILINLHVRDSDGGLVAQRGCSREYVLRSCRSKVDKMTCYSLTSTALGMMPG